MKPINMKTWEVQAILDNRKTVARRVVKPQNKILENPKFGYTAFTPKGRISVRGGWKDEDGEKRYGENFIKIPYCPGDILYVRETWAKQQGLYWHKAGLVLDDDGREPHGTEAPKKWRPSIHMPREAARIFLRVTDVKVEKLRDITNEQAIREGIEPHEFETGNAGTYVEYRIPGTNSECPEAWGAFTHIWNSTLKPKYRPLYGWEANPWCWVVEFERISKEEAVNGTR